MTPMCTPNLGSRATLRFRTPQTLLNGGADPTAQTMHKRMVWDFVRDSKTSDVRAAQSHRTALQICKRLSGSHLSGLCGCSVRATQRLSRGSNS
jgi:hypothetical protein